MVTSRCICGLMLLIACLPGCGSGSSSSSGSSAAPSALQQAAFTQVNTLRAQAQVPPLQISQPLDVAATRHAGYQALKYLTTPTLVHFETLDGTAATAADTTNPLYTAILYADRIRLANTGADLLPGSTVSYCEELTSAAGPPAVSATWNSVYHRLPLCRHATRLFGFGDAEQARNQYPAAAVPSAVTGYGTIEVASATATITPSWWPSDGITNVPSRFSSNLEVPDPIGLQQPGNIASPDQSPAWTSDIDVVGPPMHVIIPTSRNWASITVQFSLQGSSVPVPVYVLVGLAAQTGFPAALPTGATCYDKNLDPGEVVIVPQMALTPHAIYQWRTQAQTVGPGPDQIDTGIITFTVGP